MTGLAGPWWFLGCQKLDCCSRVDEGSIACLGSWPFPLTVGNSSHKFSLVQKA